MVSTGKKKQSNRRLLSHLDEFDQGIIIGNAASERQGNIIVIESNNFTVGTSSDNLVTNEKTVNVKTLERCFIEQIDREMIIIADSVEDRIQNSILNAIDSIVAPKIELAIRSINASSGRDSNFVTENAELGEHPRIFASFRIWKQQCTTYIKRKR